MNAKNTGKSALEQFADKSVERAAAKARKARLAELREEDLEEEIEMLDELPIDIEFDDVEDAIEGITIVRANRILRGAG